MPLDVSGADWIGVRLGDTIAAIASSTTTRLELPAGDSLVDGCIAGLGAGASIEVAVGSAPPVTLTADADGIVRYEPGGTTPLDASVDADAGATGTHDTGATTTIDSGPRPDGAVESDEDGGPSVAVDAGASIAPSGCACRASSSTQTSRAAWLGLLTLATMVLRAARRRSVRGPASR